MTCKEDSCDHSFQFTILKLKNSQEIKDVQNTVNIEESRILRYGEGCLKILCSSHCIEVVHEFEELLLHLGLGGGTQIGILGDVALEPP